MMLSLVLLLEEQALSFVLAAAVICAVSGWLLAHLARRAERGVGYATPQARLGWIAGTAVIAGTGVWTTHFIAMLGYRTDIALGYDLPTTLVSALAAVAAVGLPFAASVTFERRLPRAAMGAVAGVGVGVMHVIGMAAITGCAHTQSAPANVAACLVGAVVLALARGLPTRRNTPVVAASLFVLAVCGTHFVSLAGTVLAGHPASGHLPNTQLALSLMTAGGAALLLLAAFTALATVRRFEVQEAAHAASLATALENMSNGILKISPSETVKIYNRRLVGMLHLEAGEVAVGMPLARFLEHVGRANGWSAARVGRVLANHRAWMAGDGETRVEHTFDDGRILSITCQPVAGGAVLTYDDVTKARQAQREITHLAYHDPLTGLANRRALQERMREGFSRARRFKLLLLDLDRFKFVNDTFGHGVGDRLLQQVAARLSRIAGEEDAGEEDAGEEVFAARLGGDEMALLVRGDADRAKAVAARVIEAVEHPYAIGEVTVVIGCSIGLCCTDDADGPDELMQRSDLAMYEAKRSGRGRVVCYRPGMIEAVAERNRLENDLRLALSRCELHLAYQPIQSLGSGAIVGYEALIRWQHPTRGAIPPVDFIPLAEETGLIVPIGRWVLEEACRQAMLWPADRHVAVNVSAVQFRSPLLMAHVTGALEASGLPARRLEIELTETALVEDGQQIAHTLAALRGLGIRIAMDDFGTGYSSLAHLRDLPLDRIKIDRSFVAVAMDDPHSLAVIRAVTQMGRDMGIETLAEGVETEGQLDMLRGLGCGAVQGYLIGRPERPAAPEPAAVRAA